MPDITVSENNAPLLGIRIKRRLPNGGKLPYLLVGAPTLDFYVKNKKSDLDSAAKFHYSTTTGGILIILDGSDPGATYSEVSVQCTAAHLTPPGSYPFHLDVTKSGKPITVMAGLFIIKNT